MNFLPYPFERLNALIDGIVPKVAKDSADFNNGIFKLTIGEPQFETPKFIQNALCESVDLLRKYPPSIGEKALREAQMSYIKRRFGVSVGNHEIIPTFGTREVLFNFPCFFFADRTSKVMAYPNPFYKIYEGAAIASGARVINMNLDSSTDFKPHLSGRELSEVGLVILNSPNNPTGAILTLDELCEWVNLALKYNFVILSDECYSDIYENGVATPPSSILEACIKVGNNNFKNILAINSISKRSSAPGLRSGFIAGDSAILKDYALYRSYIGCAIPLPLQKAAVAAWSDDSATEFFREIYSKNLAISREILGVSVQPYTFYVWLKVGDELEWCKKVYENEGILTLPGRFLGDNGESYVRLALVYESKILENILKRLNSWI